ncbi:MAG: ABC transporter substrate-binding protein [Acidobacteria bacterium]|nr:ABC transporter substrate-binding protein [Acidobacteriota bacterium]
MRQAAPGLALALTLACSAPPAAQDRAVVAWESFPLSLDPRQGQDQASQRLLALTHQGLLRRDPRLQLVPDACLAWRWERPFTELSFDFPDEKAARALDSEWFWFAPGRPLGVADARDAVEALRDPNLASPKSGPFRQEIQSTEILPRPGGTRLLIRLRNPNPGFAVNLTRGVLGIAPEGMRGPRLPGTGPYRIAEVVQEERILLLPRLEHPDLRRHPGRALPLELRLLPDATTRLLALRHGSVGASLNNIPSDLLPGAGRARAHPAPGANLEYVAFQCSHPILGRPQVRKALSLALDRKQLLTGLMGGLAREAWGFFPPELPHGADAREELGIPGSFEARLALAEALLDAAGWPRQASGFRFVLRISCTPEIASRMKALAIQAQWRRVGVDLRIVAREFGTLLAEVMAGKFEVVSLRWVGTTDPQMLHDTFHSASVPPRGFNRGHFQDAQVDRWLDEAKNSPDPGKRLELLRRVQVRVVDLAPYAFLWWPDQVPVLAPGLEMDVNPAGDFTGIWRTGTGP